MKKIQDLGYEALIVGGFVRDLLMGKPSDDIDLATNAPEEVLEKNFDTIDIGKNKQFGVSVIKYKGQTYEVAQYRKDLYGDLEKGKGADKVEIAKDFKDDSSRRDFTINALGIDGDGNIVDHHGGLKDIDKKVIAAVGDADIRFKEDEVRQLRGIRFASRMGFEISPETIEAMKKHAPEISKVAPERITKELRKIAKAGGKQLADAIVLMDKVGILQYILPEIAKMKELEHSPEHHPEGNVFQHTLEALRTSDIKDDVVNVALLFHDLG
jgi:tRNA nucleotidyltransferase/poly(A) polymerase